MPGAVARTASVALNNATLPFTLALADKGFRRACADDPHLRNGLNVHAGRITYRDVAEALDHPYTPADDVLHFPPAARQAFRQVLGRCSIRWRSILDHSGNRGAHHRTTILVDLAVQVAPRV